MDLHPNLVQKPCVKVSRQGCAIVHSKMAIRREAREEDEKFDKNNSKLWCKIKTSIRQHCARNGRMTKTKMEESMHQIEIMDSTGYYQYSEILQSLPRTLPTRLECITKAPY